MGTFADKLATKSLEKRLLACPPGGRPAALPDRDNNPEAADRAEAAAVRQNLARIDAAAAEVSGEGFTCTLVFATRSQCAAFLAGTRWPAVFGGRYVDGVAVAAALGVRLPPARPTGIRPPRGPVKADAAVGFIPAGHYDAMRGPGDEQRGSGREVRQVDGGPAQGGPAEGQGEGNEGGPEDPETIG